MKVGDSMKKIGIILTTFSFLVFFWVGNYSYANRPSEITKGSEAINMATSNGGLGDLDKYKGSSTNSDKFKSKVNNLLIIVKTVGIILSVIALAIIGIKYMIGSIEERAEYKKTMIPYLVGVFLVFSVTTIPQLIYSIVNDL